MSMNEQELKVLVGVYQRRLTDAYAQAIALEAKTLVQQEIINNLQQQLQEQIPKKITKKPDVGEF
jgi:hypothetical protein